MPPTADHHDPIFTPLTHQDPREVSGYLLRARIGEGGMGAVYLSYTPGGRPVALKIVRSEFAADPEFRRRFATEVSIAQRVQGLYTAPVIDCDPSAARPWLATGYVAGPSLAAAVSRQGPLPPESLLVLIAGIAEALQAIHSAGIIHRDLKPGNVIVANDGPRLIDFGISRALEGTSAAMTQTGIRLGTPAFMSPEQVRGTPLGPASDLFSLGSTCYYAVTGEPPFGTDAAVFHRIENHPPDWDRCPEQVRDVLERCLAKQEAARPTPSALIELCRAASTDERLRVGEGWLPATVAAELTRYSLAEPPPPPGTHEATGGWTPAVPGGLAAAGIRAVGPTTPSSAPDVPDSSMTAPAPVPRRSGRLPAPTLVVLSVVLVLGVIVAVVALMGDDDPGPGPSSGPSADATIPAAPSATPTQRSQPEAAQSSAPTQPPPQSGSPSPAGQTEEPPIEKSGTATVSENNSRHFDADLGVVLGIDGGIADFTIDYDTDKFEGASGALAVTDAIDWHTCRTATNFGAAFGAQDLRPGLLLCGNTSEGRVVGITILGARAGERDAVATVTFTYTTWDKPDT